MDKVGSNGTDYKVMVSWGVRYRTKDTMILLIRAGTLDMQPRVLYFSASSCLRS